MHRRRISRIPLEKVMEAINESDDEDNNDDRDPDFEEDLANSIESDSDDDNIPDIAIRVRAASQDLAPIPGQPDDYDHNALDILQAQDNGQDVTEAIPAQPQRARKRKRNESQWKKEIKRHKVNTGQIGKHGDSHGRKVRETCTCKRNCTDKISQEERIKIHSDFWKLNSKTRRRDFVVAHVCCFAKKRCFAENSKRQSTYMYMLPKQNTKVTVCKVFFLNTLDISDYMVRYNIDHSESGVVVPGPSHEPVNKTMPGKVNDVEEHIKSFPKVESHYCRFSTKREYLEPTLNIRMMYRLYNELCGDCGREPVKENVYRKIFNEKFNLGFHKPSKDMCDTCALYDNLKKADGLTKEHQTAWDAHLARKVEAREAKAKDKVPMNNRVTAVFDLQQVMVAPKLNIGTAYYLRKLNVYNFTILDITTMKGECFLWHEGEASRGANEISTAVTRWLNEKDQLGMETAILYSDTCGGQNRNRIMTTAIIHCLSNAQNLNKIEQKFFEPGHSQNECDSMHSCIEGDVNKQDVHLPSQYQAIIKKANKKQPYSVTEITNNDVLDYDALNELSCKTNSFAGIMNTRQIVYTKDNQNEIIVEFGGNIGGVLERKSYRKRGSPVNFITVSLQKAYNKTRSIDKEKKQDIIKLCAYLPQDCRAFYQGLRT